MKFSSEIEMFKRATHQTPIFLGGGGGSILKIKIEISSEIEVFERDGKFQARLIFFDLGALRVILNNKKSVTV